MNTITLENFHKKIMEHGHIEEIDGEDVPLACPNGIIKEKGKPDIVWAEYNHRIYYWELIK